MENLNNMKRKNMHLDIILNVKYRLELESKDSMYKICIDIIAQY